MSIYESVCLSIYPSKILGKHGSSSRKKKEEKKTSLGLQPTVRKNSMFNARHDKGWLNVVASRQGLYKFQTGHTQILNWYKKKMRVMAITQVHCRLPLIRIFLYILKQAKRDVLENDLRNISPEDFLREYETH